MGRGALLLVVFLKKKKKKSPWLRVYEIYDTRAAICINPTDLPSLSLGSVNEAGLRGTP